MPGEQEREGLLGRRNSMCVARRCEMTRGLRNSYANGEGRREWKVARDDVGKRQELNDKRALCTIGHYRGALSCCTEMVHIAWVKDP